MAFVVVVLVVERITYLSRMWLRGSAMTEVQKTTNLTILETFLSISLGRETFSTNVPSGYLHGEKLTLTHTSQYT